MTPEREVFQKFIITITKIQRDGGGSSLQQLIVFRWYISYNITDITVEDPAQVIQCSG